MPQMQQFDWIALIRNAVNWMKLHDYSRESAIEASGDIERFLAHLDGASQNNRATMKSTQGELSLHSHAQNPN